MTTYLDVAGFIARTIMPAEDAALVDPTFVQSRLEIAASRINNQLRKRYSVPFTSPVPEIVLGWQTALVTPEVYRKRGWNPSDEQAAQIEQDRKDALDEIKQAADSDVGLFDLPLRDSADESAITKGGPFSYSEVSPYTWTDVQAEAVRE